MEQIPLAYGLPKETISGIMLLYKNTKVKVRSPKRDTDFFDISGVLQWDTLALYLFVICLDYALRTSIDLMKQMCLLWKTQEANDTPHYFGRGLRCWHSASGEYTHSGWIPTDTLEWAVGGIGLHVNTEKKEFIWFNLHTKRLKSETSRQVHLPQK